MNEKQKELDDFIKKQIPDLLIVNGKYGPEIIITSIRNKIAHPSNIVMDNLIKEVESYIDPLRNLIKQKLLESISNL